MLLHRPADALSFLRIAGDFLSAGEAVRNLPLSIARQCVDDPWRYPGPNYFAAVEGASGIEGVALMTPPHRVQLFVEPESAVALVADDLVAGEWVGALSQRVLDEGRSFCFLFTDVANRVSNSIYPKVGYRAVADFAEIDFIGRLP